MRSHSARFRLRWIAIPALAILCLPLFQARGQAWPRRKQVQSPHPLLVGYFPQWGLYYDQPYYVKQLVDNGSAALLDQINYAQGFVSGGKCSVADPRADLNTTYSAANSVSGEPDDPSSPFRGYFHQLRELKKRYPRLKILISLEGAAAGFSEDAKPENRKAFVASCVDTFIHGNFAPGVHEPGIFDGFDIDWEYPQAADAANFRALLEEFRKQMRAVRPGLRLSIAVGHSPHMLAGVDFAAIAPLVDQIGVMNYDYTGPWSKTTGFLAPLFTDPADPRHSNSIDKNIADYKAAGVPAEKLLMGVPFYGYSWTGVERTNNGLFQAGHGVHGDEPYHYIRTLTANSPIYRDPRSCAPWLYDGETFWTYEDAVSVRYKVSYAANQHLGGVMIWELSEDTTDAVLLNTAHSALLDPMPVSAFENEPEELHQSLPTIAGSR
jgi:chitinase